MTFSKKAHDQKPDSDIGIDKNYKNMDDQGYKHQVFYANIGA